MLQCRIEECSVPVHRAQCSRESEHLAEFILSALCSVCSVKLNTRCVFPRFLIKATPIQQTNHCDFNGGKGARGRKIYQVSWDWENLSLPSVHTCPVTAFLFSFLQALEKVSWIIHWWEHTLLMPVCILNTVWLFFFPGLFCLWWRHWLLPGTVLPCSCAAASCEFMAKWKLWDLQPVQLEKSAALQPSC